MKRRVSRLRGILAALALSALLGGLSGCKQGVGEVCQIDTDCQSGLVCNQATKLCEDNASTHADAGKTTDAGPVVDAPSFIDARVPDAGADDATPADAGTPDAS